MNDSGRVHAIFVTPVESGPTRRVPQVHAVAGAGLRGDYRCDMADKRAEDQLTLVAREAVESANREHGLSLGIGDTRRNMVTEGIDLNALVGKEFTVGTVRVRALDLCEPCAHLQNMLGQPVVKALVHRGGLRAEILSDGTVHEGDRLAPS